VQVNLDFEGEKDAVEKIRTAYGVTSIVTALYADSAIVDGRPSGVRSYRAAVWLETDEARCGLPPFVFAPDLSFGRYAEWALDVPMFFLQRDGVYRPAHGCTFRRFWRDGLDGARATLDDWELHLTTLFPEVRLKRTIELRGADAAPMPFAEALGALWRGLLDDPGACKEAWGLVAGASTEERLALRRSVPAQGLAARLGGHSLKELAGALVAIARDGLGRLPGGAGDAALLEPLAEAAASGRCPADQQLDDFESCGGDRARLCRLWDLAPPPSP
jgi:glutamate--cysteine ligase